MPTYEPEYDSVYGPIGRLRGPWLTRTAEGWLLQWERRTTRYTLGYRICRFRRRAIKFGTHPQIHGKRFGVHLVRLPMTDLEIERRWLRRP